MGSAASGSNSLTVNVGTGTTALDLVYLMVANGANTVTGVSDTQGNNYAPVVAVSTGGQRTALWAALAIRPLAAGTDSFTMTSSSTTGAKLLIARGCSGVASATPDTFNQKNGSSASPSSNSTGNLSQPNELVVGAIQNAAGGWRLRAFLSVPR